MSDQCLRRVLILVPRTTRTCVPGARCAFLQRVWKPALNATPLWVRNSTLILVSYTMIRLEWSRNLDGTDFSKEEAPRPTRASCRRCGLNFSRYTHLLTSPSAAPTSRLRLWIETYEDNFSTWGIVIKIYFRRASLTVRSVSIHSRLSIFSWIIDYHYRRLIVRMYICIRIVGIYVILWQKTNQDAHPFWNVRPMM